MDENGPLDNAVWSGHHHWFVRYVVDCCQALDNLVYYWSADVNHLVIVTVMMRRMSCKKK